jgi:methionine biosynthesis protein MetW
VNDQSHTNLASTGNNNLNIATGLRVDLQLIADKIKPGTRVLDVGCGDGALLNYLATDKDVDGRGIELSQSGVNACVARGLAVIQGDADTDLTDYPSGAFDYVILSQTLQAVHQPHEVLRQMLRIGRRGVVSFPNFGCWRVRWDLLTRGRMPITKTLDQPWYTTPNIHMCTVKDFVLLCADLGIIIEQSIMADHNGQPTPIQGSGFFANLLSEQGVFVLKNGV